LNDRFCKLSAKFISKESFKNGRHMGKIWARDFGAHGVGPDAIKLLPANVRCTELAHYNKTTTTLGNARAVFVDPEI